MAKRKERTAKTKPRVRSSLLTRAVILLLLLGIGWQLYHLHAQVTEAENQRIQLAAEVAAKEQENSALAEDIAEGDTVEKMEELARDELDWVGPGEYVFYDVSN